MSTVHVFLHFKLFSFSHAQSDSNNQKHYSIFRSFLHLSKSIDTCNTVVISFYSQKHTEIKATILIYRIVKLFNMNKSIGLVISSLLNKLHDLPKNEFLKE